MGLCKKVVSDYFNSLAYKKIVRIALKYLDDFLIPG